MMHLSRWSSPQKPSSSPEDPAGVPSNATAHDTENNMATGSFRALQIKIIEGLVGGQGVFALIPTTSDKSM